eukprot:2625283-Rhodomonas_salina.1
MAEVTAVRTGWSYCNDLHAYSVALRAWTDLSSPASGSPLVPYCCHGMAVWEGVIYIFGGRSSTGFYLSDLHSFGTPSFDAVHVVSNISEQQRPCPGGFYCPPSAVNPLPCAAAAGAHCPAGSTTDTTIACPPGFYCTGSSTAAEQCPAGFFCSEGATF